MISIKIKVLRKGDSVLNVWDNRIAIRRKSGEVDVLTLSPDEHGVIRLDYQHSYQITFGNDEVEMTKRGSRSARGKGNQDQPDVSMVDDDEIKVSTF